MRLDLDPDIVAAMDDDFDFDNPDNELEDDFVTMANQSGWELIILLALLELLYYYFCETSDQIMK